MGVGVGVAVGAGVAVGVAVGAGVGVGVAVGAGVGVDVGAGARVGVGVAVGADVAVGVGAGSVGAGMETASATPGPQAARSAASGARYNMRWSFMKPRYDENGTTSSTKSTNGARRLGVPGDSTGVQEERRAAIWRALS